MGKLNALLVSGLAVAVVCLLVQYAVLTYANTIYPAQLELRNLAAFSSFSDYAYLTAVLVQLGAAIVLLPTVVAQVVCWFRPKPKPKQHRLTYSVPCSDEQNARVRALGLEDGAFFTTEQRNRLNLYTNKLVDQRLTELEDERSAKS